MGEPRWPEMEVGEPVCQIPGAAYYCYVMDKKARWNVACGIGASREEALSRARAVAALPAYEALAQAAGVLTRWDHSPGNTFSREERDEWRADRDRLRRAHDALLARLEADDGE